MPASVDAKVTGRTAPPPRSAFRFWTEEKLRNTDTDQFRHVNNAVVATLLEAARMEVFAASAIRALMDGANLAVVRLLIDFRREMYFPGRVEIGTIVTAVGRTSFSVRQAVFESTNPLCAASAEATCVLLHPGTGGPHAIAPALRAYLLADDERRIAA
jgi:acyl-CoA thioester hydrolase